MLVNRKRLWWIVGALLIWSYFARPVYDFLWIVAWRVRDKGVERAVKSNAALPFDDVVDINSRIVDEISRYIRNSRERVPALKGFQGTAEDYGKAVESRRAALKSTLGYPPAEAITGGDFSGVGKVRVGEDGLATYDLLTIPAVGNRQTGLIHGMGLLICRKSRLLPECRLL